MRFSAAGCRSGRPRWRRAGWVLLVALATVVGTARAAEETATDWQTRLRQIGAALLDSRYEEAESESESLAREMADSIVSGAGADLLLAMTSTYRALATAGLGRGEEAVWHWQVAQQLFPGLAELDLSRFGPPGSFLAMHPPRQPTEGSKNGSREGRFVPPSRLEAPAPEFPAGRVFRGLRVDVVVQVVVDEQGRPREPVILSSEGEPTLVWATLEALRSWRFEPATRDGRPEPSLYRLTASYVVPQG